MALPTCECVGQLPQNEKLSAIYCALLEINSASSGNLEIINVTSFGATGDGVTDDNSAISEAIAQLNERGGILYFPPGVYLDSGTHVIEGPVLQHAIGENDYAGNFVVAGAGTASVWKYTGGEGSLITIQSGSAAPSNVVFRDIQINGTQEDPWPVATVGIDTVQASVDFQFDNVQINNFQIGMRCYDNTSVGLRQVYFRECQTGLAGDYKFDAVVLDRVGAQSCDIGINLGYYNPDRTYALPPPANEAVNIIGGVFGQNRIALIIGGRGTRGVNVFGCYFESSTEADIDIGHNTVDFSGNELEGASVISGVNITGCYFQTSVDVCRVWCPVQMVFGKNAYNGPSAPYVSFENSDADASSVIIQDVVANVLEYSGGTQISGPVATADQYFRGKLIVNNVTDVTPVVLNGVNTGLEIQTSGVAKGLWALPASAGAFFLDANAGDMAFRSVTGQRVLMGVGSGNSTMQISETQASVSQPFRLQSYTVAGLPAAASNGAALIYVSNESGGAVPAFSDGTNWRRVTDRAIVS